MNKLREIVVIGITLLANGALPAGEAPDKLPEDGWWVRYYVTMKRPKANDEITMKRTYSLVGTTKEDDRKCRWVEMKSVQTINGKEQTEIIKFLVPERELLEGEKPLESLVRCWRRIDDGLVEAQRFSQPLGAGGFASSADFAFGRDFVVFPGPRKKSKVVDEPRVGEHQQGRLEIAGGRATERLAARRALTNGDIQAYIIHFTVWDHSILAPAFAAMREWIEYQRNGMLVFINTSDFVIEDFGIDAKSALPENN